MRFFYFPALFLADPNDDVLNISASSSVPIQTAYSRLQSLESGESNLASSGPSGHLGSSLCGFGPLVQPIGKPRSLSVPGADLNAADLDRMISLDRDEWEQASADLFRTDQSDSRARKSSLYGTGTLGSLLPPLQPAAYFTNNARYFGNFLFYILKLVKKLKKNHYRVLYTISML